jgi:hypothetical protein
MIAVMQVTDLRDNTRAFLDLAPEDMPAVYGTRLPTLFRGRAVMLGAVMHKIAAVRE